MVVVAIAYVGLKFYAAGHLIKSVWDTWQWTKQTNSAAVNRANTEHHQQLAADGVEGEALLRMKRASIHTLKDTEVFTNVKDDFEHYRKALYEPPGSDVQALEPPVTSQDSTYMQQFRSNMKENRYQYACMKRNVSHQSVMKPLMDKREMGAAIRNWRFNIFRSNMMVNAIISHQSLNDDGYDSDTTVALDDDPFMLMVPVVHDPSAPYEEQLVARLEVKEPICEECNRTESLLESANDGPPSSDITPLSEHQLNQQMYAPHQYGFSIWSWFRGHFLFGEEVDNYQRNTGNNFWDMAYYTYMLRKNYISGCCAGCHKFISDRIDPMSGDDIIAHVVQKPSFTYPEWVRPTDNVSRLGKYTSERGMGLYAFNDEKDAEGKEIQRVAYDEGVCIYCNRSRCVCMVDENWYSSSQMTFKPNGQQKYGMSHSLWNMYIVYCRGAPHRLHGIGDRPLVSAFKAWHQIAEDVRHEKKEKYNEDHTVHGRHTNYYSLAKHFLPECMGGDRRQLRGRHMKLSPWNPFRWCFWRVYERDERYADDEVREAVNLLQHHSEIYATCKELLYVLSSEYQNREIDRTALELRISRFVKDHKDKLDVHTRLRLITLLSHAVVHPTRTQLALGHTTCGSKNA
jgi:hypothetical protein